MLRVALVQQFCEKAAIQRNLEDVSRWLDEATARQVDIIGFPEMNITGYADPNRYPEAVIRLDGPEMAGFLRRTVPFDGTVLAGLIEKNPAGKPFITQVAARRGKLLGAYRKISVAEDEADWFAPGSALPVFHHGALAFGIAICADIDSPRVFADLRRQGAQIVFELAAPGLYGDQATRDWRSGYAWWEEKCRQQLGGYAREHGYWIAVATQAGRTLDEDFPGGGYLFTPRGERSCATSGWQPGALFLEIGMETGTAREIG